MMPGLIPNSRDRKRAWRAALACAIACVAVLAVVPARAAEDEEDIDSKIIGSVLKGLGLREDRAAIEYRERSPLVIPPNRALPEPEGSAVQNNPNWPVDPEIKYDKQQKASARAAGGGFSDRWLDESRPLRPNEIRRGTRAETGVTGGKDVNDQTRPLSPRQLGYKGGLFDSLFNTNKEETVAFPGEPPRTSLIEPPAGYQTASPNQPYGLGKERGSYKPSETYTTRSEVRP